MQLRPYQQQVVQALFHSPRKGEYAQVPTGAGKSVIIRELVSLAGAHNCVVVTENVVLREQFKSKYGVEAVCYASLNKVEYRSELFFIFDEAHNASSAGKRFETFMKNHKDIYFVGLTATPMRGDKGLDPYIFRRRVYTCEYFELVREGYLTPLTFANLDLLNLHPISLLQKEQDTVKLVENLVTIRKIEYCKGVALVFLPCIDTCEKIEALLKEYGYKVKTIHSKAEDKSLEGFNEFDFVLNVNMLTTGFDYPALDLIIIARATQSTALYLQILGRGTRLSTGKKECKVYDLSYLYKGIENYSTNLTLEITFKTITEKAYKCSCGNIYNDKYLACCPNCGKHGRNYKKGKVYMPEHNAVSEVVYYINEKGKACCFEHKVELHRRTNLPVLFSCSECSSKEAEPRIITPTIAHKHLIKGISFLEAQVNLGYENTADGVYLVVEPVNGVVLDTTGKEHWNFIARKKEYNRTVLSKYPVKKGQRKWFKKDRKVNMVINFSDPDNVQLLDIKSL